MRPNIFSFLFVFILLLCAPASAQNLSDAAATCEKYWGEDTVKACTMLIESNHFNGKGLVPLLSHRAAAYSTLGQYREAITDLDKMLLIDPNLPLGYGWRGEAHVKLKENRQALADLDKAVALNAGDARVFYLRGGVHEDLGEFDLAIRDYDRSFALNPNATTLYLKSQTHAAQGKLELALADAEKALALAPDRPMLISNKCILSASTGKNLDGVLADCRRILPQGTADTFETIGIIYFYKRDNAKALQNFDAAIGADPKAFFALYMRGLTKRRVGDQAGADRDIADAKALNGQVADLLARYGIRA